MFVLFSSNCRSHFISLNTQRPQEISFNLYEFLKLFKNSILDEKRENVQKDWTVLIFIKYVENVQKKNLIIVYALQNLSHVFGFIGFQKSAPEYILERNYVDKNIFDTYSGNNADLHRIS